VATRSAIGRETRIGAECYLIGVGAGVTYAARMADDADSPESSREVSAEDFLFHLYRGSELLQDDRVHEAKQELEHALSLQPRDAKGQDLLAIVYFRLGLYPRAISIFEGLITEHPDATTPRINLALCYLKTGQPTRARVELEHVIRIDPSHSRAWGYLGLSFQRMGDVERAIAAFQAGGHHQMAKRLAPPVAPTLRPLLENEREALSRVGGEAFRELDREGAQPFRAELGRVSERPSGTWAAMEPGRALTDLRVTAPPLEEDLSTTAERRSFPAASMPPLHASLSPSALEARSVYVDPPRGHTTSTAPPVGAVEFAREQLLVFPRDHSTSVHPSGCVLIHGGGELAVRFDAVRAVSYTRAVTTRPLVRRVRGREGDEPLGSASSPLVAVEGVGELVLGPPPGTKLVPVKLGEGMLSVRESAVIALDGPIVFESARLPGGDGDFVPMVSLRGPGTVTLALPKESIALELSEDRSVSLRAHSVLGWTGRVSPRAVLQSEAPMKARGLVALSGEGMVLVDGR
jgi:Flp pilus assembly protein TadD/uncharacterized protein (AIM24 family)